MTEKSSYKQCLSCGQILLKDSPYGCCGSKNKSFAEWPCAASKKLISDVSGQDLNTTQGQQIAVMCLYTAIQIIFEKSLFFLICSLTGKDYKNEFNICSYLTRDLNLKLYDELTGNSIKDILKANDFPSFLGDIDKIINLRDKLMHSSHYQCSFDEIMFITSLSQDFCCIFAFLNNEVLKMQKKKESSAKQYTAMVVDDEEHMQELLANFLNKEGLNVITASSGEDALNLYKEHKPDIIFLDISLPGMDGFDVVKKIREMKGKTAIYFISGISGDKLIKKGEEMGAQGHLVKPISLKEMTKLLRTNLDL
ncbi:MAG: response regulator [Endomicrobiales bacterium]|nr:response regulator [Endomicrobiales bacterium]